MIDRLDISIGGSRSDEQRAPDVWTDRGLLKSEAGFRSGSGEFDRMLERFHTIFAEMDQPSAVFERACDAADDLARHYLTMTGRDRPAGNVHAGELAESIQSGLIGTIVSLTDVRGQSMLRLLS